MTITIQPNMKTGCLRVAGDIETTLHIPADRPMDYLDGELVDTYYISLSDGTLIRAQNACPAEFEVVIEGAGQIDIDQNDGTVHVHWPVEWINLASNRNASAVAQKSARNLPLFAPDLGRVSAIL